MAETDLISRQAAIRRYCGEHCGCEPQDCGLTMLQDGSEDCDFVRFLKEEPSRDIAPSAQPERKTGRWSGLWSEPQDNNSIYGEKLMEGDTIYLLGVEGTVTQECGAWGWGSPRYVPWDELEKRMPHGNSADFCFCDNFVSFWELKWNFDDGYDWDGVPFIRHGADMRGEQNG